MTKPITSEDEFREAKFVRDGYVVITDVTRNTVHVPRCADVDIGHFREKVLKNSGMTGGYYLVDDLVEAREEFKAKKCENCRPK